MTKQKRFQVQKLDFGKGYVITVVATGQSIQRTWNMHYRVVKDQCDRMNAKIR